MRKAFFATLGVTLSMVTTSRADFLENGFSYAIDFGPTGTVCIPGVFNCPHVTGWDLLDANDPAITLRDNATSAVPIVNRLTAVVYSEDGDRDRQSGGALYRDFVFDDGNNAAVGVRFMPASGPSTTERLRITVHAGDYNGNAIFPMSVGIGTDTTNDVIGTMTADPDNPLIGSFTFERTVDLGADFRVYTLEAGPNRARMCGIEVQCLCDPVLETPDLTLFTESANQIVYEVDDDRYSDLDPFETEITSFFFNGLPAPQALVPTVLRTTNDFDGYDAITLAWDTRDVGPGEYSGTLRIADDTGRAVTQVFNLTVVPRPDAPAVRSAVDTTPAGGGNCDSATADLDGDGDADLVTVSEAGGVTVHLSDGAAPPAFSSFVVDATQTSDPVLSLADIDGDTFMDIVVASFGQGTVWYRNTGAATVSFEIPLAIGPADARWARALDFDGDGDTDLVTGGSNIEWHEKISTFPPSFISHVISTDVARNASGIVFDADGDTDLDVVSLVGDDFELKAFLNNGGSFSETLVPGTFPEALSVGDLDGDGIEELISASERLQYWSEQGGSFVRTTLDTEVPRDDQTPLVLAADFDGDADTDIVVSGANVLRIFRNSGGPEPTFSIEEVSLTIPGLSGLGVGDIDADGLPDIFASSAIDGSFRWFERGTVTNIDTTDVFLRIQDAVNASTSGDTLVTSAGLLEAEDTIDFLDRGLDVFSAGPLLRPNPSETILSGGLLIAADPGEGAEIQGNLTFPGPGSAALFADTFAVRGSSTVTLGDGVELEIGATSEITFSGGVEYGPGSRLVLDAPDVTIAGRPDFQESDASGVDSESGRVLIADLDGDGDGDLVTITGDSTEVLWLENDGQEPPGFMTRIAGVSSEQSVTSIGVGDLDGDGDIDIAAAAGSFFGTFQGHPLSTGNVTVFENLGGLPTVFAAHVVEESSLRFNPTAPLVVADVNDDGLNEVLYRNELGYRLLVNSGGFVFDDMGIPFDIGLATPVLGDVDGDGDLDGLRGDGTLVWYETTVNPSIGFTPMDVDTTGAGLSARAIADLDGDGRNDLIVGESGDPFAMPPVPPAFLWYRNLGGEPVMFERHQIGPGFPPDSVTPFDLDLDGDLDLLVDAGFGALAWYENDGEGLPSFIRSVLSLQPRVITGRLSAGDIDGDGDPDFASVSTDGTGISWFNNTLNQAIELSAMGATLEATSMMRVRNTSLEIDSGGVVVAPQITIDPNASLRGSGLLMTSDFFMDGVIEPLPTMSGPGLTVSGNYAQSGTMRLDLAPPAPMTPPIVSPLNVGGTASLGGGLISQTALQLDGDVLAPIPVVTASQITTRFDVAFLPGVTPDAEGNGRFLRVEYPVAGVTNGTVSVNLVVDSLSGQIETEGAEAFDVNGEPVAAAVGDLNNDGLIDLALAVPDPNAPTSAPGSAVVLYNAGSTAGVWNGFANSTQLTVGVDPSAIAFGEADLDGGLDLAVANSADDTVTVITNDGLGTPTSLMVAQVIFVGDDPQAVAFGDLDEDKWDDIAVANFGSDNITILQNQQGIGAGWMGMGGAQTLPAGDGPIDIVFGDLDEDKWDDVVVLNANDGTVTYFDNTFPPGTIDPPMVLGADAGPLDLGVADLDGDGVNDIFTANPGADSVSIILNNGDSTFEPVVNLPLAGAPRSIAAVDLDDDLDRDLAIIADDGSGTNTIRVLRNDLTDGQLIFAPDADIDAGGEPLFVLAGDVDDDGQGDLITVNSTSGARSAESGVPAMPIGVVRQSAAPCLGDCDGNGVVEFNDLVTMLFEFGNETAPVECDADASGVVEFNDLVTALFAFGPCP